MGDIIKGLQAGFLATLVLAVVLFVQQALGMVSDFNLFQMLMVSAGTPDAPLFGWALFFVIGTTLWGLGFAAVSPQLPGPHWLRGLLFGAFAWLVMMTAFLPTVGLPMFARGHGLMIPLAALVMHLFYGVVLGEAYHLLLRYSPGEVDENA